jgi:hypothetical protein
MEYLTKKPYFLTDEDILWVGNTLADMMPTECTDAAEVRKLQLEGRPAMVVCNRWDGEALAFYAECITAGVMFFRVAVSDNQQAEEILTNQLHFNGIILCGKNAEDALREESIKILSLQAALGLHKM